MEWTLEHTPALQGKGCAALALDAASPAFGCFAPCQAGVIPLRVSPFRCQGTAFPAGRIKVPLGRPHKRKGNPMNEPKLTGAEPVQFGGSENWYRHGLVRSILFTDGAKYVADKAGAYWLLNEIALAQRYDKSVAAEEFQLWRLTVNPDHTAVLGCEDGNGEAVLSKDIPFTDFPLDEIKFYVTDSTILLPSEY